MAARDDRPLRRRRRSLNAGRFIRRIIRLAYEQFPERFEYGMIGFLLASDLQKLQYRFQREPQLERTFQLGGRRDIVARVKGEVGGEEVRCRVIRRQTDGAIEPSLELGNELAWCLSEDQPESSSK